MTTQGVGGCYCGARWTGYRPEHCTACHQTFGSTYAGDMHRVGDHHIFSGPDRRRCLTPDEMRNRGMRQDRRGIWIGYAMTNEKWK